MIRKVITINEDDCNGCGLCANACHEGAIGIVDGKAKLLRDDYCDGLGNCLPVCPTGAITFEEREAAEFDEAAVEKHRKENRNKENNNRNHESHHHVEHSHHAEIFHDKSHSNIQHDSENESKSIDSTPKLACGCPSTLAKTFDRAREKSATLSCATVTPAAMESMDSNLRQWPVQIQLVPVNAPYFNGAHLLVAADCAAYSHPSFNQTFMKNKITIIGCPKLDHADYAEKLTAILASNSIKSLTVVRMEVPCCGGIVAAAVEALKNSGKMIPWNVVTLGTDGSVLEE